MQDRHKNRKQYFEEQANTTRKYVIPYIESVMPISSETRVMEVGCGEGGNMLPFLEKGCEGYGMDLIGWQIENAKEYMKEYVPQAKVEFSAEDIYNLTPTDTGKFDLIMLRDVIEHIHDQAKFMKFIKQFLKPGGRMFFGFPPWYMPYGGHQQAGRSKWLKRLPYSHLLPYGPYKSLMKAVGETDELIGNFLEIKDTGISTARFQKICKEAGFVFEKKDYYLFNPNYEAKFGLKPKKVLPPITSIPFFRDFVTTCMYAVIRLD